MQHEPFGELVERENEQREREDAAIWSGENGWGGGHASSFKFQDSSFKRNEVHNPKSKVCPTRQLWIGMTLFAPDAGGKLGGWLQSWPILIVICPKNG
jgi:hypothetical protein